MPHTLRTKRLVLQPINRRHARALWQQVRDYDVLRNTSVWPYPLSYAQTLFMVSKLRAGAGSDVVFAVVVKGEVAGLIGLHRRRGGLHAIGYMLGTRFWGRGIATEAVEAVCRFGFRQLRVSRIVAEVYKDNPASERVLERTGFTRRPSSSMGYSTARGQGFPITTWDLGAVGGGP